ncbi:MAG: hypothetical protein HRU80_07250 [Ignavibacteriales bacterium]|nr:hypothetical protein [Ignavibacteriaceae bacterium]QOJ28685.1 MAG: hypothetical protein HRU80_07250 [Ignavibacteriales bacterium]
MQMDWTSYIGKVLNITMHENYGIVMEPKSNTPIYEIVFKSGQLVGAFSEGLLLETTRENETVRIFIPHNAIKCVEIFGL